MVPEKGIAILGDGTSSDQKDRCNLAVAPVHRIGLGAFVPWDDMEAVLLWYIESVSLGRSPARPKSRLSITISEVTNGSRANQPTPYTPW